MLASSDDIGMLDVPRSCFVQGSGFVMVKICVYECFKPKCSIKAKTGCSRRRKLFDTMVSGTVSKDAFLILIRPQVIEEPHSELRSGNGGR